MIVLHALGQCLLRTAVTTISPRADTCFALASYLTHERGRKIPRRSIEKLFWPATRAADAAHSLSEIIHKLRRKGVPIERDDASCIWLPRDRAAVDVESLSTETAESLANRDLAILPGYTPRCSPAFSDWLDDWRGRMQLSVLATVLQALTHATDAADWRLALALANKALAIDADCEPALVARARAARRLVRQPTTAPAHTSGADHPLSYVREHRTHVPLVSMPAGSARHLQTPLVGRDDTMELLRSLAARSMRGRVGAVFLWGPGGIGKTRLLGDVAAWMQLNGAAVWSVAGCVHDAESPFAAIAQAVPRLQNLRGAAGCAPATVLCLQRLIELSDHPPDQRPSPPSAHASSSVRAAVVDLIDAVAHEQPLLVLVDNAHWIDAASWAVLRYAASRAHSSVLALCSSRVRWQHSAWGDSSPFTIQHLPALSRSATRAHVINRLAAVARNDDDAFIDWCADASSGNPQFVEEIVDHWSATGERCAAPPALVSAMETRLACLRPEARRAIQAAAILGTYSTFEMVQQVLGIPTHTLLSALEEIGDAGLLSLTPSRSAASPFPMLSSHALVVTAAGRGVSGQTSALLHHAAAEALERHAAETASPEMLWESSAHWYAAGQADRGVRAAVACARQLHLMGMSADAVTRCEAALAAARTNAHRGLLLRTMAHSQCAARDWSGFSATTAQLRRLDAGEAAPGSPRNGVAPGNRAISGRQRRGTTLEDDIVSLQSESVAASERVRAAVNGLKLASNLGAFEKMDEIFDRVSPLLCAEGVHPEDRLMLMLIYNTVRGDTLLATRVAHELLDRAERESDRRSSGESDRRSSPSTSVAAWELPECAAATGETNSGTAP